MQNMYYSLVGTVAVAIHLIINYEILFKRPEMKIRGQRAYRAFLCAVLAYYITDVLWGILDSMHWNSALYCDTIIYYTAMGLSVILWCRYVIRFLELDEKLSRYLSAFGISFCVFEYLALFFNHFVPIIFTFDENGAYQVYLVRHIILLLQIAFFLLIAFQSTYMSVIRFGHVGRRHLAISCYGYAMVFSFGIQIFVPLLPIYTIGLMIGSCLLHVFVQEDEKDEVRKLLQEKQAHLEESSCEQEVQIEEITELNQKLQEEQEGLETRYSIIKSMSKIYFVSYYIDLQTDTYLELAARENIRAVIQQFSHAQEALFYACKQMVVPEFQDQMMEFWDLSTIDERLKDKDVVSSQYVGVTTAWSQAYLIAGDRDENGKLLHIFFSSRMIHDEKQREDEQMKQLEEYNRIVSSVGMGIWHILFKEGKKPQMRTSDMMRFLLGVGKKELSEEEIYEYWYQRIDNEFVAVVEQSIQRMKDGKFTEIIYLWNHPARGKIFVRCGGTFTREENGTVIIGGCLADVNEIVLQEEQQKKDLSNAIAAAEAANHAKTDFLFSMSHDIRTPMNAIIGFANLLEKHLEQPDKARDYLGKIQNASDVLLSLINNVLEMARIESGKLILDEAVCNIPQMAEEICAVFLEQMREKKINFISQVDVREKNVYTDRVQLNEIFLNLLSNAYKYTPEGGSVSFNIRELPCEREGYMELEICVSDTGIGMSQDFLPQIFEAFSRERTATETRKEGTGLGMPIVKRIVELFGGTIQVESELGKGATFLIRIPQRIAVLSEEDAGYRYAEKNVKGLEGKRILIAEDNQLNAEIVTEILQDWGMEVERAEDGIICVDMIQKGQENYYDLILMDVQMPNMNGYEACKRIRSMNSDYCRNIPIIALTANAFEEDRQNAITAGMDGHLAKPINTAEMLQLLSGIWREPIGGRS